jgi:hypothetical protein
MGSAVLPTAEKASSVARATSLLPAACWRRCWPGEASGASKGWRRGGRRWAGRSVAAAAAVAVLLLARPWAAGLILCAVCMSHAGGGQPCGLRGLGTLPHPPRFGGPPFRARFAVKLISDRKQGI